MAELISIISFYNLLTTKHYDKEISQVRKMAGVKRFQFGGSTLEEKVTPYLL